jgi:iron complex outermembrane receptor protein
MKTLGYGIPSLELGWSNRFTYKNWDLNVFFRGAFGHSLVNQFRGFYEPLDPGAINSYNRIITDKAVAGLTSAQYSSLYVEKADFLKLDNLTLGYNFKLNPSSAVKSLRLYFSGQNLFLITKYTGIDPEPQLQDYGNSDNGGFVGGSDVLAPGIDRRNNYFFSRILTFGLNLGF